jgi:hypothetical protein
MANQAIAFVDPYVQTSQGVLPVGVIEATFEGAVEQGPQLGQLGRGQISGVTHAQPRHSVIVPVPTDRTGLALFLLVATHLTFGPYEERYGFPPKQLGGLAICAAFTAAAIWLPMGTALRIATLVFFGGGMLVLIAVGLSRRVALRVDHQGIVLGGSAFRYEATTRRFAWPAVSAVVLWRMNVSHGAKLSCFSVVPVGVDPAAVESLALAQLAHPISGWKLDPERLTTALRVFAPNVAFVDRRKG